MQKAPFIDAASSYRIKNIILSFFDSVFLYKAELWCLKNLIALRWQELKSHFFWLQVLMYEFIVNISRLGISCLAFLTQIRIFERACQIPWTYVLGYMFSNKYDFRFYV